MALLASGYVNFLQYANTHSIQFQIIMKQIISCSKLSYLLGSRIIHEIRVMYLSMQVEKKKYKYHYCIRKMKQQQ